MAENENGQAQQQAAFEPITSQDQLNQIIHDRIERAKSSVRNEYGDYDDLKAAKAELDQLKESQKTDLEKMTDRATKAEQELANIKAYQKLVEVGNEMAEKYGVPFSLLRGSNAKEIEEHAKAIAEAMRPGRPVVASDGQRVNTPDTSGDFIRDMINRL